MMMNLRGLKFDDPSGTVHMSLTPIAFDLTPDQEGTISSELEAQAPSSEFSSF